MRRSRAETAETRRRAVRAASRLFRARGFEGASLDEIMRAIGMTRGGFYRHFASKDALAAEAIESASIDSVTSHQRKKRGVVERYLSREHVEHPESGCPLAALGCDTGRQPAATRRSFARAIERALDAIPMDRERAIHTLASMVGALVLARAVSGEPLSDELLAAVRAALT